MNSDGLDPLGPDVTDRPVELIVLAVKPRTARCRFSGTQREITLRASGLSKLVPGEIVTVEPRKQTAGGKPSLTGDIQSTRLDVPALGLVPLALEDRGIWRPEAHYWGEAGEPLEAWAKPIHARGPRPAFEMEQIVPGRHYGVGPNASEFVDPIVDASELIEEGDDDAARELLMSLCAQDLRCLAAHSDLGTLCFERAPERALRHYQVGVAIGELSLGPDFDGVLLWGFLDNRPFLRCLHGLGLALWRRRRFEEAERTFVRMLWLNPSDNQGVRFLLDDVRARTTWRDLDAWG